MKKRNNEGFTLIEVALSIVVVAIGIMAVFSLIGSGLESNRKAISESQAAIFANDVFNSLRSASQQTNVMFSMLTWEKFWSDMKPLTPPSPTPITLAGAGTWSGTSYIYANGSVCSIVYSNAPVHAGTTNNNIVNGSLQYQFVVAGPPVDVGGKPVDRVNVTLYVWDGMYAQTDPTKALVFYTEYNNPGELK